MQSWDCEPLGAKALLLEVSCEVSSTVGITQSNYYPLSVKLLHHIFCVVFFFFFFLTFFETFLSGPEGCKGA